MKAYKDNVAGLESQGSFNKNGGGGRKEEECRKKGGTKS